MKSFVSASWLNLKRAARAAYYGASCAHCVCVCVYLCMCVCVLPTCECVCAAVFVHKANIYTQWNIIKTLKIYHIMRGVSTGCKRAAATCLSLSPLSSSLSLCGTVSFIAHPQPVNFPMPPPPTPAAALVVYPVVLRLPIEA